MYSRKFIVLLCPWVCVFRGGCSNILFIQGHPQWSSPLVFTAPCSTSQPYKWWSVCPTEYSWREGMWLPRLGFKRLWLPFAALPLSLLNHLLWGKLVAMSWRHATAYAEAHRMGTEISTCSQWRMRPSNRWVSWEAHNLSRQPLGNYDPSWQLDRHLMKDLEPESLS